MCTSWCHQHIYGGLFCVYTHTHICTHTDVDIYRDIDILYTHIYIKTLTLAHVFQIPQRVKQETLLSLMKAIDVMAPSENFAKKDVSTPFGYSVGKQEHIRLV